MKTILAIAAVLALAPISANAQNYVHGYTNSGGTYVQPYYRSAPNNTQYDNYSSSGNVNPYTGAIGTRTPHY